MASNEQQVYQQLNSLYYSPEAIAGIMGNWYVESSFDPTNYNPGENAHGLAQWEGPRWPALQKFAQSIGLPWSSIVAQVKFFSHEISGTSTDAALRAATTPAQAATIIQSKYERSSPDSLQARINAANQIYKSIQTGNFGKEPSATPSGPNLPNPNDLNQVTGNLATAEGTLIGGPVVSGGVEGDVTQYLGQLTDFAAKTSNPVAAALGFVTAPLAAIAKFFSKLVWIFNIDHFIKFMLYMGGGVLAITGLAIVIFGAGHNEGEPAT